MGNKYGRLREEKMSENKETRSWKLSRRKVRLPGFCRSASDIFFPTSKPRRKWAMFGDGFPRQKTRSLRMSTFS